MDGSLVTSILDNLDPHVALKMLEKLTSTSVIDNQTASKLRLKYLGKTHLFSQLKDALKSQDQSKAGSLLTRIQEAEDKASKEIQELESFDGVKHLKKAIAEHYECFKAQKFVRTVLEKNEDLDNVFMSRLMLTQCIKYARMVYNCGQYDESIKMINVLYTIAADSNDLLNLIWAKLANTLVLAIGGSVDHARGINDDLRNARSRFDFKSIVSHAQRVTMACSLVFHAMAAFYCSADKDFKFDTLFDMFLDEKFLGAIQLGAPVLLRYLVLLYMFAYERKSLKVDHNTLVDIIRNEVCEYKDVFVQFVTTLYIDFDLVAVGDQIQAVSQEVSKDIIFSQHASVVVENCKKMYFEVYCKMYNSVDLATVATFLGIDKESAEIWIVNLLRKNNISARMSDAGDCIYIGGKANNENENLNKRAKELMSRNKIMLNNAAKFLS